LHDLGIIVNSIAYTKEYRAVIEAAAKSGEALDRQERQNLGFTHGESGIILARSWKLPAAIVDVIEWHHDLEQAPKRDALIALVHLGIYCAGCADSGMDMRNGAEWNWRPNQGGRSLRRSVRG